MLGERLISQLIVRYVHFVVFYSPFGTLSESLDML